MCIHLESLLLDLVMVLMFLVLCSHLENLLLDLAMVLMFVLAPVATTAAPSNSILTMTLGFARVDGSGTSIDRVMYGGMDRPLMRLSPTLTRTCW